MVLSPFRDKQTQLLWDFHHKNRICCQLWVQLRWKGREALFIYLELPREALFIYPFLFISCKCPPKIG